jgi:hypothetical protein
MAWQTVSNTRDYPNGPWPEVWVPDNVSVSKYNPPTNPVSIIGIVAGSATLTQCVFDNATGLSATLTQTIFDTTTRADSAQILLTNGTGSAKIIRGAVIRAKMITMLSGTEGYLNDKYVDYESIANNGERKLEIGNDFVVTFAQVNQLADYNWKMNRMKRHLYTLSLTGCQTFFEPGEWYTLTLGGVGTAEYISAVVMCYNMRTSITAGGIGSTQITFLEMYQNWVFDSNEVARSIASGQFNRAPTSMTTIVAASTYMGTADYYCDGTADDVEINAAIVYMAGKGGGTVQLTEGTFNLAASINLSNNICLAGMGNGTILYTTAQTFDAISSVGTVGTPKVNIRLMNFCILNGVWVNNGVVVYNINFTYTNNSVITGLLFRKPGGYETVSFNYCSDDIIFNCIFDGELVANGKIICIASFGSNRIQIANNILKRLRTEQNGTHSPELIGISSLDTGSLEISNNSLYDFSQNDATNVYGMEIATNYCKIFGNKVESLKNTNTATAVTGIHIVFGSVSSQVSGNYCFNNGSDTGLANTNHNNFYDQGTDTDIG